MRDSEIKTLFAKADEQVHVDEIRKQKTYHTMIEEMEKQRTPMMSAKNILFHQFWYMDKLFFAVYGVLICLGIIFITALQYAGLNQNEMITVCMVGADILSITSIGVIDKLFFGKMAELGESCYFNTKQCVAAWLVLSGMINVMILFLIAGYLNYHWRVGLLQVGLYILTPYLVSSIIALGILSMEKRGKNSYLFGMTAIFLSISYGVIGSIPRALFVTTLWIWENRVLPTERYFLGETELGKAYDEIGKTPYLAYTTGWKVFVEMLQFGLILGSILIICEVSTIFAEESQTKMLPLIFSTEEGRRKDVPAKILASFTFTIFIFMWFVLVNLVLCWMIYGLKGFENISWMVLSQHMLQPVLFLKYLGILLGLAFQALLSLCAITLCVSAYQDNSFGAVIIAAACWGLPVLIRMLFGGIIWLIVDSMPIFLVMTGTVNDIYEIWYIVLGINVCFAIGCLVK